jgi:hypothetical protein
MKATNLLFPVLMMIAGIYFGVIPYFHLDLSRIPGDYGDARFNNYILEHGYLFFTGKISEYWNAPFFYPFKNVIALTDNLLGSLPIYVIFRSFAFDRETAFQLWLITICILNYWAGYYLFKKLSGNTIIAACCAFIYGFGLYNHGQIFHAQVFPRFIAPLVIYWTIQFLQTKKPSYLFYFLLGLAYQFYCGIYLGFFLLYFIIFLFLSYIIIYRKLPFKTDFRSVKMYLAGIFVMVVALLPLFLPYIHISHIVGDRSYDYSLNSLPRFRSYFFTSPAATIWKFLYPFTAFKFILWWNHLLFPGIIPWLGVFISPIILLYQFKKKRLDPLFLLLFITFILSFIFCINYKNYSLYKIIYLIPGFSSMRSIDRIINIQILFFLMLTAFVLKHLYTKVKFPFIFILLLPLLTIIDNLFVPEPHKSFAKSDAQIEVQYFKKIISELHDSHSEAISFYPVDLALSKTENKNIAAVFNTLSIMLACQELNIKCVNGYSGFNPGSYLAYFENPSKQNLERWCTENNEPVSKVQPMNDIETGFFEQDTIQIRTTDSMYWCMDKNYNNFFMANRKEALSWDTFIAIKFKSGQTLLSTLDQIYCKVDPFNKRLIGYKSTIANADLISIIPKDSTLFAIKVYEYYATVNQNSREVQITDSLDNHFSIFTINPVKNN